MLLYLSSLLATLSWYVFEILLLFFFFSYSLSILHNLYQILLFWYFRYSASLLSGEFRHIFTLIWFFFSIRFIEVLLLEILFSFLEILFSFSTLLARFIFLYLLLFHSFFTWSKCTHFIFSNGHPKALEGLTGLPWFPACSQYLFFWIFGSSWLWVHTSWVFICWNYFKPALKFIFSREGVCLFPSILHCCQLEPTVNPTLCLRSGPLGKMSSRLQNRFRPSLKWPSPTEHFFIFPPSTSLVVLWVEGLGGEDSEGWIPCYPALGVWNSWHQFICEISDWIHDFRGPWNEFCFHSQKN